jgi:hypothetical protein
MATENVEMHPKSTSLTQIQANHRAFVGTAEEVQFTAIEASELFGNGQPQPQSLLFMEDTIKLDEGSDVLKLLTLHPASGIADGQGGDVVFAHQRDIDAAARFRKFEGIVDNFTQHTLQVILGDGERRIVNFQMQIIRAQILAGNLQGNVGNRGFGIVNNCSVSCRRISTWA